MLVNFLDLLDFSQATVDRMWIVEGRFCPLHPPVQTRLDIRRRLDFLPPLRVAVENLRAHHESLAQVVNQVIDDGQACGLKQS